MLLIQSPRPNVFPAGVANFGKAMYRSLERSTQDTRDGLGKTLRIKDDVVNKLLYIDGKVDGKRLMTKARYNKCKREEALSKLTKKQQQLIDELTIDFN